MYEILAGSRGVDLVAWRFQVPFSGLRAFEGLLVAGFALVVVVVVAVVGFIRVVVRVVGLRVRTLERRSAMHSYLQKLYIPNSTSSPIGIEFAEGSRGRT